MPGFPILAALFRGAAPAREDHARSAWEAGETRTTGPSAQSNRVPVTRSLVMQAGRPQSPAGRATGDRVEHRSAPSGCMGPEAAERRLMGGSGAPERMAVGRRVRAGERPGADEPGAGDGRPVHRSGASDSSRSWSCRGRNGASSGCCRFRSWWRSVWRSSPTSRRGSARGGGLTLRQTAWRSGDEQAATHAGPGPGRLHPAQSHELVPGCDPDEPAVNILDFTSSSGCLPVGDAPGGPHMLLPGGSAAASIAASDRTAEPPRGVVEFVNPAGQGHLPARQPLIGPLALTIFGWVFPHERHGPPAVDLIPWLATQFGAHSWDGPTHVYLQPVPTTNLDTHLRLLLSVFG